MIYQFETEGIEACGDCPCCDSIGGCTLGGSIDSIGEVPDDCPLVAISKTETVSKPCEYCDGKEKPLHCLRGEYGESICVGVSKSGGYVSVQKDGDNTLYAINYCPNCGRRIIADD